MKRLIMLLSLLFAGCMYAQQPLTLEACRDLAIHNNKELQIAAEKIKIAEYEKKAAFTKYFPEVSATGVYMWNEKDLQLVDPTSLGAIGQLVPNLGELFHLDIQNIWVGRVTLMQPVFMGGKIINYNQITSYARELAESMHDTKLQEIIYQTDQSYWQVISLVNKQKLADAYVQLLQKMDRDVDEMISEGVATRADGLSVKVKLNEAEMVQNKVENGLALSRMLLSQLCGLSLDTPLFLADEHIEIESVTVNDLPANVNEAFLNRPELRSLDLATKIYKKKENIELANLLPTVALSVSYLTTNPSANNGFKNEFNGMFHVGLLASVPLSGWWEGTHKRNSARAETIIRKLEFEDTREKIELQVNQSLYQINEAHKRLTTSTRNMESAEENLRHANIGFEEGVIPALNLMEAQTAWLSAHSELIDAQIEVKLTKVYLTKALGKLTLGEQK